MTRAASTLVELLVTDAVRLIGVLALAALQVLGVVRVVALEEHDFAVAFEREDMGRDAVEEPAVVRDHDGAAREIQQRVLERAQRLDVEVVRRLVEQQQVAARGEHLGEMNAIALAAGEQADLLLLVSTAE